MKVAKRTMCLALMTILISTNHQLFAQADMGTEENTYDEIHAARVAQNKTAFNLKGNVRKVTEINLVQKDSTIRVFNGQGLLTSHRESRQQVRRDYVFEAGKLTQLIYTTPGFTAHRQFGDAGYLLQETSTKTGSDPFRKEATYIYDLQEKTLEISYQYDLDTARWDVVLHDTYSFTVNNRDQATRIRHLSRHRESTYASTATCVYDAITGNLLQYHFMDDCAETGGNSCANYHYNYSYDARNNLIAKSVDDQTVRNSFSRGYTMSAAYNEHGDLSEFSHFTDDDQRMQILLHAGNHGRKAAPAPVPLRPFFDYTYDANGNWIEKYEVLQGSRRLISSRIIIYAD